MIIDCDLIVNILLISVTPGYSPPMLLTFPTLIGILPTYAYHFSNPQSWSAEVYFRLALWKRASIFHTRRVTAKKIKTPPLHTPTQEITLQVFRNTNPVYQSFFSNTENPLSMKTNPQYFYFFENIDFTLSINVAIPSSPWVQG